MSFFFSYLCVQFIWLPYTDSILNEIPGPLLATSMLWRAMVPMICYHLAEWHHPDRAMQQFGMQQPIPQAPLQSNKMHDISLKGKEKENWVHNMRHFIARWNNRYNCVQEQPLFQRLVGPNDDYTMWYAQHSRRWITRDAAITGELAQGLHRTWFAVSPQGQGVYTQEQILSQLERCLTLVHEVNRILVPSTPAPALAMEVPHPTQDDMPRVGGIEGQGIERRREAVFAEDFQIAQNIGQPSQGLYNVDSQTQYSWGYGGGSARTAQQEPQTQMHESQPMWYGSHEFVASGSHAGEQENYENFVTPQVNPFQSVDWAQTSQWGFPETPGPIQRQQQHNFQFNRRQVRTTQANFQLDLNQADDGAENRHRGARDRNWPHCCDD